MKYQLKYKAHMRLITDLLYIFDGHAFIAKLRGGVGVLQGKYWPEILWSEDGLDFAYTGGRLKISLWVILSRNF